MRRAGNYSNVFAGSCVFCSQQLHLAERCLTECLGDVSRTIGRAQSGPVDQQNKTLSDVIGAASLD